MINREIENTIEVLDQDEIMHFLKFEFNKFSINFKEIKGIKRPIIDYNIRNAKARNIKNINTVNSYVLKRNFYICKILLSTGIRPSELNSIKKQDIFIVKEYKDICMIKVKNAKGRKKRNGKKIDTYRIVYCKKSDINNIKRIQKNFKKLEYTNCDKLLLNMNTENITTQVKNFFVSIKINKNITPRILRHTFATTILKDNRDEGYITLLKIKELMGHSSIDTTINHYLNVMINPYEAIPRLILHNSLILKSKKEGREIKDSKDIEIMRLEKENAELKKQNAILKDDLEIALKIDR